MKYFVRPRTFFLLFTILSISFLVSCGTSKVWVKQNLSMRDNSRLAVVDFEVLQDKTLKPLGNVSKRISDGLTIFFLQSGFNVIERTKLDVLTKEMKLQKTGVLSQIDRVRLGKIANVKYLVYGSGNGSYTYSAPFVKSLTVKMIEVESGETAMVLNWAGAGVHVGKLIDSIGTEIVEEFNKI